MAACLFLYALLLPFAWPLQVSAGSSLLKCNLISKLCKDGSECVLHNNVCDGEADCRDGSDEEDCAFECSKDQFQCAHGKKCIEKDQVCDGVPQCQDRSDEVQCLKRMDDCIHSCDDGNRCLPASFLCDGEQDCLDATDEANCGDPAEEERSVTPGPRVPGGPVAPVKCTLSSRPCKNNAECVLHNHVCDGEADCSDGSDEEECPSTCETSQFQCAHGKKCIEQSQVCDGVPQCQDRSDEQDCAKHMDGCSHQCDGKSRCLPNSFLCDGEMDCLDGSDEANCAEKSCSATEFKCTTGQCVSSTMRCDGHPDCKDQSDESGCTTDLPCTSKHYCPISKECLALEWICDGDQDCKDGTDEEDCPIIPLTCGEFQWSCKSRCIPTAWRCDGAKDCEDGSDETECGAVPCLPHQFRCGSQECLDPALVCNGMTNCADGSDEGGNCHINCGESDKGRCSQSCYSTPQGTRCHCTTGFKLLEDGTTCADVDECNGPSADVCSQLCVNTPGSYRCECQSGYIMESGGHHCKISGEPYLLMSVQTDLFVMGLRRGSLDMLSSTAKKAILSLDYDWRDQKVFWVSLDTGIRWSSLDQKNTGMLVKGVRADSVAVDWLGRNLYWIDGMNSVIVAIRLTTGNLKSPDQTIILDEDLEQPRSLALLPQKGLMFWSEIGSMVKIERAGMDGSERVALVNSSLGWPGAVTVDAISNRVYWTDERLGAIGSATLDGEDIRILQMKETANPFSVAVFNDMLYWSDVRRRVVLSANKLSGKNPRVLIKRPRQPFGVKIIHPWLQIGSQNPCEKMACSHMCVLAPGPKAVCKCGSGLLLSEDGLTCSSLVNSAFLLMLSPSTVTQIYLQTRHSAPEVMGWPEHLALQLPSVSEAAILDYNLHDHTLLLTDDATDSLSAFKPKDSDLAPLGQLLKLLGDSFTAMALDWVTHNIYWSSVKQRHLQVTSVAGAHTAILIQEGIGRVGSIALHPPAGRLCFANLGQQGVAAAATVECANMDGDERVVVWKSAVQPTSVVFSNHGDMVYWADTTLGTIGSAQPDGSGYRELKVGEGLAAVALTDDALLWMTVTDKTRVLFRDEQHQNKLWFEVGTKVVSMKAFSSQSGSNKCTEHNGGCQHLCLATPGGRKCRCDHNHVPVNATHCSWAQHCPEGSRSCLDRLACQPAEKFCDGRVDCTDHSDENCVGPNQRSEVEAVVPLQPRASAPSTTASPSVLKTTSPATTPNTSNHLEHLDAQQCSQTLCSNNGRCVKNNGGTTCKCSLGYSGDSCQNPLLKTMQGPIIYGAAGLCVAVVFITVMAVALTRKRSSDKRASSMALKETRMSDLENKAETGSGPKPAEPEKTEEVVSTVELRG